MIAIDLAPKPTIKLPNLPSWGKLLEPSKLDYDEGTPK
jgi:hypothetical protein